VTAAAPAPGGAHYVACGACRCGVVLALRGVIVGDCWSCHYHERHAIWKWETGGMATA
jgi:hypothetical protein